MAPLERPAGENPYKLMAEIQDVMSEHAPIVRDEAGLSAGLAKLSGLKVRAEVCGTGGGTSLAFNPGWHTAYDLRSLVVNAEALLRSALMRKESRGAHARSDYPSSDDQLVAVNYVVEKGSDDMQVRPEPRPPMPGYLADAVQRSYARYTPEETE
jgi:succinate dehydrogenase / fumarate reductase flavoprotein subunit